MGEARCYPSCLKASQIFFCRSILLFCWNPYIILLPLPLFPSCRIFLFPFDTCPTCFHSCPFLLYFSSLSAKLGLKYPLGTAVGCPSIQLHLCLVISCSCLTIGYKWQNITKTFMPLHILTTLYWASSSVFFVPSDEDLLWIYDLCRQGGTCSAFYSLAEFIYC